MLIIITGVNSSRAVHAVELDRAETQEEGNGHRILEYIFRARCYGIDAPMTRIYTDHDDTASPMVLS